MTTPLEHLSTRYHTKQLTRAEYRDALKALYLRENDVQQLARIRAQFVSVSMVAA